jgi:hypothetical protein
VAELAELKARAARAECAPGAESPKIEVDQVELERAGARINDVVAWKTAGALAGGSAKVNLLLSALTRASMSELTRGAAHGLEPCKPRPLATSRSNLPEPHFRPISA